MQIDLLAFGPHPDDVELGMGGTLFRHTGMGQATAIVDLTQGEMGSNGTPEQRVKEGEAAATILGCAWRRNLALPDRALDHRDPTQVRTIVETIRTVRPRLLALNWGEDRHPDHVAACRLLEEAVFNAGLRRYETDQEPFRPVRTLYYFINDEREPSFLVDVTAVYDKKIESLFAHHSQFARQIGGVETRLNRAGGLPYLVESRDRLYGAKAGVQYAEAFIVKRPLLFAHLAGAFAP